MQIVTLSQFLFLKVLFVCEYWVQIYLWEHKVGSDN